MSETERIARLERLLEKLCSALSRRGTEQDGNWGWPSFAHELAEIQDEIKVSSAKL